MERVLNCVELLNLIFGNESTSKNLALCARVCRSWFTVAIPILWRSLDDMEVLFRLLPFAKRGRNSMIAFQTSSETDWERFNVYAKFVRTMELRLDFTKNCTRLIHKALSNLAYTNSKRCLVPNIDKLEMHYDEIYYLDFLFFVGTHLRHLIIKNLDSETGLYNTFNCILLQASCITSLSLECVSTLDTTAFDNDLHVAFGRLKYLKELTISKYKLTSKTLISLASLPQLMTFNYTCSTKLEWKELDGELRVAASALGDSKSQLKEVRFTSGIATFSKFLSMAVLFPSVETLYGTILDQTTNVVLRKCAERIAQNWGNLSILDLQIKRRDDSAAMDFSVLEPLSSIHSIVYLYILSPNPLIITDNEIEGLTKCWPRLESFGLSPHLEMFYHVQPTLTLSSLTSFANNCPSIKHLLLSVDCTKSFKIPSGTPIMKNLRRYGFQRSPVSDPDAVALELSNVVGPLSKLQIGNPDLKTLDNSQANTLRANYDSWLRVKKSLELIFEVLRRQGQA